MEQQNPQASRGVITMAFGKPLYVEMAKSLARSMKLHAPKLPRAILTDSDDAELAELFTHVIPHRPEFGWNMGPKFYLDQFSPFAETLYVDSDSLVLSNLDSFWKAFAGQYFGVLGWRILRKGEIDPFIDVAYVLERFELDGLPKFNGGVYYVRRCEETSRFFNTARDLFSQAKNLRVGEFYGGGASDEPVFALAMALHGLSLTSMGTGGMWTRIQSTGLLKLDVLAGSCSFTKEGRKVYPDIVHFAGEIGRCFEYPRECARLKVHFDRSRFPWETLVRPYLTSCAWQCYRTSRTLAKTLLLRQPVSRMPG